MPASDSGFKIAARVSGQQLATFAGVVSPGLSLFPLRRGPRDPSFQVGDDGAIWRTSLLGSGPVTARISRAAPNAVECTAWGSGAEEFLDVLPVMLGSQDDASDFVPTDPTVAAAHRRVPHLRLGRTDQVLEALIPALIEQRVPGAESFRRLHFANDRRPLVADHTGERGQLLAGNPRRDLEPGIGCGHGGTLPSR